jgi:NhaA family Na+:H+ antiporter
MIPRAQRPPKPLRWALRPFQEFAQREASAGILLFLATVAALVWANSPAAESYTALLETKISIGIGERALSKAILLWINDGLMAVFFFLVGLEIKRELVVGELSSPGQTALPIAGAIGGMLGPAAIYLAWNAGTPGARGWAVPMATDIAFALGVLVLLGPRVPLALKVFVTALAIVDDLASVAVIALFYTGSIGWVSLSVAASLWVVAMGASRAGLWSPWGHFAAGVLVWLATLLSGVHATVAGVMMAFTVPLAPRIDWDEFVSSGGQFLAGADGPADRGQILPASLAELAADARSPLTSLEHALHPWISFVILPLFALANAGVALTGEATRVFGNSASIGVFLGLVVGKPLGIAGFAWMTVKAGVAKLPPSLSWRQILGAGCLAGIGFTMSLFIGNLSFTEASALQAVKVSILAASLFAGTLGALVFVLEGDRRE